MDFQCKFKHLSTDSYADANITFSNKAQIWEIKLHNDQVINIPAECYDKHRTHSTKPLIHVKLNMKAIYSSWNEVRLSLGYETLCTFDAFVALFETSNDVSRFSKNLLSAKLNFPELDQSLALAAKQKLYKLSQQKALAQAEIHKQQEHHAKLLRARKQLLELEPKILEEYNFLVVNKAILTEESFWAQYSDKLSLIIDDINETPSFSDFNLDELMKSSKFIRDRYNDLVHKNVLSRNEFISHLKQSQFFRRFQGLPDSNVEDSFFDVAFKKLNNQQEAENQISFINNYVDLDLQVNEQTNYVRDKQINSVFANRMNDTSINYFMKLTENTRNKCVTSVDESVPELILLNNSADQSYDVINREMSNGAVQTALYMHKLKSTYNKIIDVVQIENLQSSSSKQNYTSSMSANDYYQMKFGKSDDRVNKLKGHIIDKHKLQEAVTLSMHNYYNQEFNFYANNDLQRLLLVDRLNSYYDTSKNDCDIDKIYSNETLRNQLGYLCLFNQYLSRLYSIYFSKDKLNSDSVNTDKLIEGIAELKQQLLNFASSVELQTSNIRQLNIANIAMSLCHSIDYVLEKIHLST